jgi:hypothetical protein
VLTRILRLRTAPTSVVGSNADMGPMTLHGHWTVEIKEGLAATACNKLTCFQYMPTHYRGTCKMCGQTLLS